MDPDTFMDLFIGHEGRQGAGAALRSIAEHPTGRTDEAFNVWTLSIDADNDSLGFAHDFDPYEGEMALSKFIKGMTTRLA